MKPVLSDLSKIDKRKVLKPCGCLMQIESIAAFCNTFDLHKAIAGLENPFLIFLRVAASGRFYCSPFHHRGIPRKVEIFIWIMSPLCSRIQVSLLQVESILAKYWLNSEKTRPNITEKLLTGT